MPDKAKQEMPIVSAERELELIRYALDKSAIVAITDRAGRIIHINDKFCEISQYSREELLGQNHRIINSGYHGREFFNEMWKTISSGQIWEGELRNRAKDGSFYWVHTTIVPFADTNGRPYQYVSIRYDITQKKLAAQAVLDREAQILVQDRLASVGMLASSLAHEIGTPLGVIRGRAEYLEMKLGKENPEAMKTASVIISQIDRVTKLIRSLLNLARGEIRKPVESVAVKEIVHELGELLGHDLRRYHIDLRVEMPESLNVLSESGPLHQVLLNLLVNSIHAIEAKRSGEPQFIKVSSEDRGDCWAIKILDSGCGIAEENMKKLFQPFFTTKDIGKGTGLGLATSFRLVESWSGKIEVHSRAGEGAEFTLVLPKG